MTNLKVSKQSVNVGVDVGKLDLDIHIYENNVFWKDENSTEGIKRILKRLSHYKISRLVMKSKAQRPSHVVAN
jgi:transposase